MQTLGNVGQLHHAGAEAVGQCLAAFHGAVGNHHLLGIARGKVGAGQFDHLAGAHEQDADLAQVLEQLRSQTHGSGGHADAVRTNFGAAAHQLGHGETALEQLVERGAEAARSLGGAHGILHLAQDLRLAQHHAVQPAGHAEGMARHGVVLKRVGVVAKRVLGHIAGAGQPCERVVDIDAVARAVHLGAVARGDDGCFGMLRKSLAQAVQGRTHLVDRKREAAAQIQRCGVVVDA